MRRLTQEEFIEKVKKVHGDKYDYSKSVYKNKREKLIITCPIHGDFKQIAGNHMNGQGCPKCGKIFASNYRKNNYKHFIEVSTKRFNNKFKYPYIETEYENNHSKITFVCNFCGNQFIKIANDHLNSKDGGCINCRLEKLKIKKEKTNKRRKLTIEEVEERLNKICGKQFKYHFEEYINTNTPFTISCLKCGGSFKRDVNALYKNHSCPLCNGKNRNRKYSTTEFIEKCNKIHGNKYDYSKTEYKHTDEKICIICHEKDIFGTEHGEFYVTPHSHISLKTGCPKCSGKYKKDSKDFAIEANYIHDNQYDYSKVNYINAFTKVCIICPEHGEFWQKPNYHLSGRGCPICKQSKCERKIRKLLKEHKIEFIPQYKPKWLENLTIDFYLPKLNIGIEVQGLQHYQPVKYWGGEEAFEKVIQRDIKKKMLCEENNVKLLYYSELNINLPEEVIKNSEKLLEKLK